MGRLFEPAQQLISQSFWSPDVFSAVKSGLVVGVGGPGGLEEVHFSTRVGLLWPARPFAFLGLWVHGNLCLYTYQG